MTALTDEQIATAQPGTELRDGAGLCVRVTGSSRTFRWYATSIGRVIRLGPWSQEPRPRHLTLDEARTWLQRLKAGHRDGRLAHIESDLAKYHQRGPAIADSWRALDAMCDFERMPDSSGVYFVEGAGLVKIGSAKSVRNRIAELQSCSPVPLRLLKWEPHPRPIGPEKAYHHRWRKYRHHGEWFLLEGEVAAFILSESTAPPTLTGCQVVDLVSPAR